MPFSAYSPSVSLVTVTYNHADILADCWKGIVGDLRASDDLEWIVVDNESSDGSREVAASLGAKVVRSGSNLGFAAANNLGIKHSSGDVVGFVNPDVQISAAAVGHVALHAWTDHTLAAPQLTYPDGSDQPNGRGEPSLWNKVRNRLIHDGNPSYYLTAADGQVREVRWLTGAVVFSRRDVMARLGGWDDSYFLYFEDVELGISASEQGVRSEVCGSASAVHSWARDSSSSRKHNWPVMRLHGLSAIRFYSRHPQFLVPTQGSQARGASRNCAL